MKKLMKMVILGIICCCGNTCFSSASNNTDLYEFFFKKGVPVDFIIEQANKKFKKKFNLFENEQGKKGVTKLTEEEADYFVQWNHFYFADVLDSLDVKAVDGFDFIQPNLDFTSPDHMVLKEALAQLLLNYSFEDIFYLKSVAAPRCFLFKIVSLLSGSKCSGINKVRKAIVYNHFLTVEARRQHPWLNRFVNFLAVAWVGNILGLAGAAWLGYHYGLPLLSKGLALASTWSSYEPGFKRDMLEATHFGAQKVGSWGAQVGAYASYIPAPITAGTQKIGAWGTTVGSYLPSTKSTLIGAGVLGVSSLLLGRRHVKDFIDEQICDVY